MSYEEEDTVPRADPLIGERLPLDSSALAHAVCPCQRHASRFPREWSSLYMRLVPVAASNDWMPHDSHKSQGTVLATPSTVLATPSVVIRLSPVEIQRRYKGVGNAHISSRRVRGGGPRVGAHACGAASGDLDDLGLRYQSQFVDVYYRCTCKRIEHASHWLPCPLAPAGSRAPVPSSLPPRFKEEKDAHVYLYRVSYIALVTVEASPARERT